MSVIEEAEIIFKKLLAKDLKMLETLDLNILCLISNEWNTVVWNTPVHKSLKRVCDE